MNRITHHRIISVGGENIVVHFTDLEKWGLKHPQAMQTTTQESNRCGGIVLIEDARIVDEIETYIDEQEALVKTQDMARAMFGFRW